MKSSISYRISGKELIVKAPQPLAENFCEEVVQLSEISTNQISKLLIDFSNLTGLSMNNLNELARLRVLSAFENIHIEFINVPPRIVYEMTKVSLDRYYPIRDGGQVDSEHENTAFCPNCDENLDDLIRPLEAKADELAQVRTQLVHLEKLNSIGQLCAGVAHEFNNIMASMKGFAQLALESKDPAIVHKALTIVDEQTSRAEKITGGLLSFSRKKSARKVPTDLNELLERELFVLKNEMQIHGIELIQEFSELPHTLCDPNQLDQVFLNLFTNAMQAMQGIKEGGTLTVTSKVVDEKIVVRIKDTGTGISAKVMEKIFDPFFTTKGALGGGNSTGTGLGLSISEGIVLSHNGEIEVESRLGEHTTFTITLPVSKREKSAAADTQIIPVKKGDSKSKSILIIDDEKNITDMLSNFLNFKGHEVRVALSAKEGIKLFKERPSDLVLLDLIMPGMNGADAFIELKKLKKNIKVAVITGHTGKHLDSLLDVMKQVGQIEIIRKPFDLGFISNFVSGA